MAKWKILMPFIQDLFDDQYTAGRTWNPENFAFVKINDRFPQNLSWNKLPSNILVKHDVPSFRHDFRKKRGAAARTPIYRGTVSMWHSTITTVIDLSEGILYVRLYKRS